MNLSESGAEDDGPRHARSRAPRTASPRPRLLIAEDDVLTRAVVSRAASDAGFEPRGASSVQEAADLVAAEHFDLALLDIALPGGSGLHLAERLRDAADVPFLFLTARADDAAVARAARIGALAFLVKPIDPATLGPVLRTACARGAELRRSGGTCWLAAELHDGLGQSLTGMSFLAASLVTRARRGEMLVDQLESMQRMLERAQADCRSLARGQLAALAAQGSPAGVLRSLARTTSQSGTVRCTFRERGGPRARLAPDTLRHLSRISQEAVANALRHAAARRIAIGLRWSPTRLVLTIRDDGIGIANGRRSDEGVGLRTMRARATALSGTLHVRAARPSGTEVRASVPLKASRRRS